MFSSCALLHVHYRAEWCKVTFCVHCCCYHHSSSWYSSTPGGFSAFVPTEKLPLWLGELDWSITVHSLYHLCVSLQDNLPVSSSVAMADWSNGHLTSLDRPNNNMCQVPQYRSLCHHVLENFRHISESNTPIHTASCHLWTRLLHDLLWTTVSG